ncbi:toll-like receptor 13 [Kryptolebias marmoratus]|uniref:toll-like receptor 13 n=1 Tax=Kryptolebias marmoratus TaxID=37003 RepID=UPI0007F93D70|nr:toll-like receptor 13 [Kryptolebias marmoratus]
MAARGSLSSHFIFKLFLFLLHFTHSLTYFLKGCNIDYQEILSADVSLNCADRKLTTVPDDIPQNAGSVQLNDNLLKEINKEDFSRLLKLKILNLKSNQIVYVEDESFFRLVSLKTLIMKNNGLTNLTSDMFKGLSNLTVLDLNNNNIQFIPKSAFHFLISLQTLDLGFNALQQVTDIEPILQLSKLQILQLELISFSTFDTKDLHLNRSSSLKELHISSDKLKRFSITTPIFPFLKTLELSILCHDFTWDIPDKTLLRNITQVYLSGSALSFKGTQKILQSLDSLTHLKLNLLKDWFEKVLSTVCKIPTLRKLDLSDNIIHNLTFKLASCSQLTEIDLSSSVVTDLPKGSIQSMKQLQSLNVSYNKLIKVPYDIRSLTSLEILNMDYNSVFELNCEDFKDTVHLRTLSLKSNRIVSMSRCVLEHLTDLKFLDLGHNQIQYYEDIFEIALHKLEFLDLSYNPIAYYETEEFQALWSLKYMIVGTFFTAQAKQKTFQGSNNLEDVFISHEHEYEPNFRGLKHVETLTIYLYCNDDFKVPPGTNYEDSIHFKSLKTLTVICRGDRQGFPYIIPQIMLEGMEHLEMFKAVNVYNEAPGRGTFYFYPHLKSLTISKTDLTDLDPEMFLAIPKLQSLDLSESNIKSLDFLLQANLNALRYLKLTDNEINVINETVFQFLPSLTYLDLSNNQFSCECSNAGFIQWIKNNKQTQVVNAHQYECFLPVDRQGTLLLDFDVQSCWNDGSFFYFISSTCLVVLTLLTSFIYHFLRWQLAYTFHLFLAFVYDSRRRKKGDPHQFDAFVSYNVHDEDWVYREMLPVLEGEQGWRLCLHHRDFQPGKPIMENITDAIYGSRKTICVISRHYLQSEWCSREIQMASFRLFDEQKDVLILLFLEDIPSRHLSPYYRMRKLVKKRTYLSWPQAAQHPGVFWQNVQRALQTGDALTEETDLLTGPAGP